IPAIIPVIGTPHGVIGHGLCFSTAYLGGSPGAGQLHLRGLAIGKPLCHFNDLSAGFMGKQIPDCSAACAGQQPQLAVARLASNDLQHLLRVSAGQPLALGHGVTPSPKSGPQPKTPGSRQAVISPAPSPSARTTPASPASGRRGSC